jgi:hypothetical protein
MWRIAIAWRYVAGAERIRISMNGTSMTVGEDPAFDNSVRMLTPGASRRTALRGLAAGLLAMAGGAIATDSLAKKKRKKKGKKPKNSPQDPPRNPPKTCPEGTLFAELSVLADGSQTFTPVLKKGQVYVLRASGYWSTNGDYMCDAFAAFLWKDQRSPVMYNNGVRLGLWVDGLSPDHWGSYTQSHTYHFIVIGKGKPISLQMLDSVYSDNGRHLYVDVLCGAPND